MQVRIAGLKDLSGIVEIYNQSITKGKITGDTKVFSVEDRIGWFESHVKFPYQIFIAEIESVVVGYGFLSPYRPGRQVFQCVAELGYYVHDSYFNKKIGTTLINKLIENSKSGSINTLIGILMATNKPSISILKKFNFSLWGTLPNLATFNNEEIDHLYYGLRIKK